MPKKKQAESSSDTSVHSSDEETKKPAKKQKTDGKSSGSKSKDDDSIQSWELGGKKAVKIRSFRGRVFVDIREYYLDKNDAEMKPGRKGIALNPEQWNKLAGFVKEISETMKENC